MSDEDKPSDPVSEVMDAARILAKRAGELAMNLVCGPATAQAGV